LHLPCLLTSSSTQICNIKVTQLPGTRHPNMQYQGNAASRHTPPPDVVRVPPAVPSTLPVAQSPNPNFLIIGLFVLRLTKQLLDGLDSYSGRDADIAWLVNFLGPYPLDIALAKISGPRMEDYIAVYKMIVSRMKRQPRYPLRFMQINPDRSMQQQQASRQVGGEELREMTDRKPHDETFPCAC
jgi:hypothetical protein